MDTEIDFSSIEPIDENLLELINESLAQTIEPTLEPTIEPTLESVIETVVEPVIESVIEHVIESTVEPTVETVVEPIVEPTVETIIEPTVETIIEPTVETVVEPTVEPIVEPTVETVVEHEIELIVEPVIENVVKTIGETTINQNVHKDSVIDEILLRLEKMEERLNSIEEINSKIEMLEMEIEMLKNNNQFEIIETNDQENINEVQEEIDELLEDNSEILDNLNSKEIQEVSNNALFERHLFVEKKNLETGFEPTSAIDNKDVLVCLLGDLNNSDLTWNSFNENVLKSLGSYDICVCIGAKKVEEFKFSQYYINAKYKWVYHEPENWMNVYQYIGNNEKSAGPISYTFIQKLDEIYGESFRAYFYHYYLKQKIDELNLGNKYKYFYLTNSSYYHENKLIPIEMLNEDFYLIETKNNSQMSFDNIISKYSALNIISNFIVSFLIGKDYIGNENLFLKFNNVLRINSWYLNKVIKSDNIAYLLPTMYKVYKTQIAKNYIKHKTNNFYIENSLNYLKILSLKNEKDFWRTKQNLIIPSNQSIKKTETSKPVSSPQPVFKKTVKGARVNRPMRKKR